MMPLETYLVSRLPSTIPMEYEKEALKAQAVVLRTEMMRLYYDNREEGEDGKAYIYVPCKPAVSPSFAPIPAFPKKKDTI